MSKHCCTLARAGEKVDIELGWDRPLQGFYLLVETHRNRTDDYIYSNLSDRRLASRSGMAASLDYFRAVLDELEIRVPAAIFDAVQVDATGNVGNRTVLWTPEGEPLADAGRQARSARGH